MSIGYACLTVGVPGTGLSSCILKNASEENLRAIILKNLSALEVMIDYNCKNKIELFRISSDIIPFGSHPINQIRWWEDYRDILLQLGEKIKKAGMRVTMHPGQYTVLNSPNDQVVQRAIEELEFHDCFLNSLRMDQKSKLILHIGGVYGDKEQAMKTFVSNYQLLSEKVQSRLIIENDDKNYNIEELLQISRQTGAPVVFDNLHHHLNPPRTILSDKEWINQCSDTWSASDGKQKIHYSQQKDGASPGSHSDTIVLSQFIEYFKGLPSQDIDIMLEVKDKNLSAIKCIHGAVRDSNARTLEEEWARYKYFVLSKSAKLYQEIRELLKDKDSPVSKEFYDIVEKALFLSEDSGAQVNALQHVWGYISKESTKAEKNRYEKLMDAYSHGAVEASSVRNHILKCAQRREINYLINSLYFYL